MTGTFSAVGTSGYIAVLPGASLDVSLTATTFDGTVQFEVSFDGGQSWAIARSVKNVELQYAGANNGAVVSTSIKNERPGLMLARVRCTVLADDSMAWTMALSSQPTQTFSGPVAVESLTVTGAIAAASVTTTGAVDAASFKVAGVAGVDLANKTTITSLTLAKGLAIVAAGT